MYHTWLEWQQSAGLESWLNKMRKRRKNALQDIIYLQYQHMKLQSDTAKAHGHLQKAIKIHSDLDFEMAQKDGRFKVVVVEKRKRKESKIENIIENLSTEERLALIEQLKKAGT